MKRAIAAALLLFASPALADEPPTGTAWLVAGGLTAGAGVVNLAGAPLCALTLPQAQRVPCAATSVAFGLAGLAVGIPLLVVGAGKRSEWLRWERHVTVEGGERGAVMSWRGSF